MQGSAAPVIIVQLSDLHVTEAGGHNHFGTDSNRAVARCLDHARALPEKPALVIASGDLTDNGTAAEYRHLHSLLAHAGFPVMLMAGNHDRRSPLREVFRSHAYLPPEGRLCWRTVVGGLHVIALDTLKEWCEGGTIGNMQFRWFEEALTAAGDAPVMLFMHHPPVATGFRDLDRIALAAEHARRLSALLRQHGRVIGVGYGHVHRAVQVSWEGVPVSVCPSAAFQSRLRLGSGRFEASTDDPPAYHLHYWDGRSLVTHCVTAITENRKGANDGAR
jgi:Icc protein